MNTDEIGSYLEEFDFDFYINKAMEQIPEGIDTREGSIIYDALAPACYQLADFTMQLKNVVLETFTQTATGGYLDFRAEEHGIKRIAATKAIVKGKFLNTEGEPFSLSEDSRFSSIGEEPIYYSVLQEVSEGYYTLIADEMGTAGNEYIGTLLPIDNFNGLGEATIVEVSIPARDIETDDSLRDRILRTQQVISFGGNIEDYITLVSRIDGVGACQIYPIWNGGGTVRVVVLDNQYNIASQSLIDSVQNVVDPKTQTALGHGLAPIGHKVTVSSATKKQIDVSVHIDTETGYVLDNLKGEIQSVLMNHFLTLRKLWSNHNDLYKYAQTIYRSQLVAQLLNIDGVANVSDIKLNKLDNDVTLMFTNQIQEAAFLGTVSYV